MASYGARKVTFICPECVLVSRTEAYAPDLYGKMSALTEPATELISVFEPWINVPSTEPTVVLMYVC